MICAWIETSSAETGSSADDELRLDGQGPRDADALPLAAAELVRVAPHRILRQADHLDQLVHAPACAPRPWPRRWTRKRLGQHGADGHARIQGGVRILEDHLHPAPHAAQRRAEQAHDLLAVELDAPVGHADQPDHGPREGRLAAARFAHQAHRLAAAHVKGHAVDGAHVADVALEDQSFLDREVDLQVANLQQRRSDRRLRGASAGSARPPADRLGHAPAPAAKPDGDQLLALGRVEARHLVPVLGVWRLLQRRILHPAAVLDVEAARGERAAGDLARQVGRLALDRDQLAALGLVQPRERAQQADRVRVPRAAEELRRAGCAR